MPIDNDIDTFLNELVEKKTSVLQQAFFHSNIGKKDHPVTRHLTEEERIKVLEEISKNSGNKETLKTALQEIMQNSPGIKKEKEKENDAQKRKEAAEARKKAAAAKELAAKELAAKELAAKELAAKELAAKELAAKELAAKELAAKELAAKEAAAELEKLNTMKQKEEDNPLQQPPSPAVTPAQKQRTQEQDDNASEEEVASIRGSLADVIAHVNAHSDSHSSTPGEYFYAAGNSGYAWDYTIRGRKHENEIEITKRQLKDEPQKYKEKIRVKEVGSVLHFRIKTRFIFPGVRTLFGMSASKERKQSLEYICEMAVAAAVKNQNTRDMTPEEVDKLLKQNFDISKAKPQPDAQRIMSERLLELNVPIGRINGFVEPTGDISLGPGSSPAA